MAIWKMCTQNCLLEKMPFIVQKVLIFILCHTVAGVHMTQWSPSALATGRNHKNNYTLFRVAEYNTDLNI